MYYKVFRNFRICSYIILQRVPPFQDLFLADLLKEQSDWIVGYHEHDSLLENKVDQELSEEERKSCLGRIRGREERPYYECR